MYVRRLLSSTLNESLKHFPAVLVNGPRQAGKRTFLFHENGKKTDYIRFNDPLERNAALFDPNGFLDRFRERPVLLDEVQYVPAIFPYLKIRIDRARKRNGKRHLTGLQKFQFMRNGSESLAGRIAILELLPFSLLEHQPKSPDWSEAVFWGGGYSEPYLFPGKREGWVRSYLQAHLERDGGQLQNIKDLQLFGQFNGLSAAYHGQTLNTAILSRQCGVSLQTIRRWDEVLEASYLCLFIPLYFQHDGNRSVKTPKLYFIDLAIVCALTRQPNGKSTLSGARGRANFEGLIVSEASKVFSTKGKRADTFFWRSQDSLEVDLILPIGAELYFVEKKSTATPTLKHIDPLNKFKAAAGQDAAGIGLLVCRVEKESCLPSNNVAMPWHSFPRWLWSKIDGSQKG